MWCFSSGVGRRFIGGCFGIRFQISLLFSHSLIMCKRSCFKLTFPPHFMPKRDVSFLKSVKSKEGKEGGGKNAPGIRGSEKNTGLSLLRVKS